MKGFWSLLDWGEVLSGTGNWEAGILQREYSTFCSLGVQREAIQSQPGHLHVQPPQNAKRCLNELKSHPHSKWGNSDTWETLEAQLSPLQETRASLVQSCSTAAGSPLGQHMEGKGFWLSDRLGTAGALPSLFTRIKTCATSEKRPTSSSGFTIFPWNNPTLTDPLWQNWTTSVGGWLITGCHFFAQAVDPSS